MQLWKPLISQYLQVMTSILGTLDIVGYRINLQEHFTLSAFIGTRQRASFRPESLDWHNIDPRKIQRH